MSDFCQAYDLFHEGALALSQAERKGVLIDKPYLEKAISKEENKIKTIEDKIWNSKIGKYWKKKYGRKASLGSGPQLTHILYEKLKLYPTGMRKGLKYKVDKEWLSKIDHALPRLILRLRKYEKILNTYLAPIIREINEDGRVRYFFHLNIASSYRSGSGKDGEDDSRSAGNFQNQPSHDPEMTKIIRSSYIPDKDYYFAELDYSSLEVRIACCFHKDPNAIKYLQDGDMHSDTAKDIYFLHDIWDAIPAGLAKNIRFSAKNNYVFASQYGSWYGSTALTLYNAIFDLELKINKDVTMLEHLENNLFDTPFEEEIRRKFLSNKKDLTFDKKILKENFDININKGYDALSDDEQLKVLFLYHVQTVDNLFWNVRFPVYGQWRKDSYERYLDQGFVDNLTGFRYSGKMTKMHTYNYPVQGSAFHVLLYAYTKLQQEITKRGLKSYLVGEIHDSIVCCIHKDEKEMFCKLAKEIMEKWTAERFEWINVPMIADVEMAPLNMPWYYKMDKPKLDKLEEFICKKDVEGACNYMKEELKYEDKEVMMKIINQYDNERMVA